MASSTSPESESLLPGRPPRGSERPGEATDELVGRALAGDGARFARLYERVAPAVHGWVSLRLGPAARAQLDLEDVVQEVWLRASKAFAHFDPLRGSFRGWIFQLTKFTLLDTFRALAAGAVEPHAPGFDLAQVPESVTSLTRRIARDEGLAQFLAEVEALPAEDRELLVICGLEGRPTSEAAVQLELSHESARKRWLRLRARLAQRTELAAFID